MVILQINFNYDISEADLITRSTPERAKIMLTVPGLTWKVWIRDAARRESGGIYYFASREEAENYVNGPIIAALQKTPEISDFSAKIFDVREDVSRVTNAPLELPLTAALG